VIQEWWQTIREAAMWTDATRAQHRRTGERYASDLTDAEWAVPALLPPRRRGGRPRTTDMRAVMNAQLYLLRTGCQWRMLPKDFPPHPTVYGYFQEFVQLRIWDDIHAVLLKMLRERMQRNAEPSAAIIDSQSVKSAEKGGCGSIRSVSMRPRKSRVSSATSPPTRKVFC
jgi:transposase